MSHHRQTLPPRVATRQDRRHGANAAVMEAARSTPLAAGRLQDGVPLRRCKGTGGNPPHNPVRKARPESAFSGSFSRVPTGTLWVMKERTHEPRANGPDAETCRYLLLHWDPLPEFGQVAGEAAAGTGTGGSQ
jgi:hypothetical protein